MFKVLATALVTLACVTAQASEGTGSEFFFQSDAGKHDVTGRLGYQSLSVTAKGATKAHEETGLTRTGVAYEYGINEMFAIEGELAFESLTDNSTPSVKESGLEDPLVTLKGRSALGFGNFRFGATLGLGGLQKSKVETNGDSNAMTGGYSFAPYVGIDTQAGPGILGGRLTYQYNMERTVDNQGTEGKVEGGNVLGLSAFYEYQLSDMILGGALNYRMVGEQKVKVSGVEVATAKALNVTGLSLWARVPVAGFDLIPRLDYDFSTTAENVDKYSDMVLSVAARFAF